MAASYDDDIEGPRIGVDRGECPPLSVCCVCILGGSSSRYRSRSRSQGWPAQAMGHPELRHGRGFARASPLPAIEQMQRELLKRSAGTFQPRAARRRGFVAIDLRGPDRGQNGQLREKSWLIRDKDRYSHPAVTLVSSSLTLRRLTQSMPANQFSGGYNELVMVFVSWDFRGMVLCKRAKTASAITITRCHANTSCPRENRTCTK